MKHDMQILQDDLKVSFSKVKEHINSLESQINALKGQIEDLTNTINSQKIPILDEVPIPPKEQVSIGNEGVHSFIHSRIQSIIQPTSTEFISKLTKQEALILLTIVQLEEELSNITYEDLASKLKLSQGCIRGYITTLIRKGVPIYKEKYNNKITIIKANPSIKSLNKQSLIDFFYKIDPYQRKLFEQ